MNPGTRHRDAVQPRAKIWLERRGNVALSTWRVALLEAIEDSGSLASAAGRLNVPYRTAWYKLRGAEQELGVRLVETHSGGAGGGHTKLTPQGRDVVERFRRVTTGIERTVSERFAVEFPELT